MSSYRLNRSVVSTSIRTGRLDLHGLSFDSVPEDLFSYPSLIESLTSLDLSQSHLKNLTPKISQFKKLKLLSLDGNLLTSLPIELAELPALKVISLEGNPLPEELLKVYSRAKNSGNDGREAAPVMAKLLAMEENEIAKEEEKLIEQINEIKLQANTNESNNIVNDDSHNNIIHHEELSRPSSSNSTSSDSDRIDSRVKQASLTSHIFSPNRNGDSTQSNQQTVHQSKKHSVMSHQPTNIFSVASEPVSSHTSKRVNGLLQQSKYKSPFGTDLQEPEDFTPRRIPNYEDSSEKENEATSLHFNNEKQQESNRMMNTGKRIMNKDLKPAPFGTIDYSNHHSSNNSQNDSMMSSNQHSQKQFDDARRALESIDIDRPSTAKLAAGRSDGQQSYMKSLLSQQNSPTESNNSNNNLNNTQNQKQGVKIVDRQNSKIFFETNPNVETIRSSQINKARSTSPWARDDDVPVNSSAVSQTRHHHQASDIFNGAPEVARTGRARIQPTKKDNSIF